MTTRIHELMSVLSSRTASFVLPARLPVQQLLARGGLDHGDELVAPAADRLEGPDELEVPGAVGGLDDRPQHAGVLDRLGKAGVVVAREVRERHLAFPLQRFDLRLRPAHVGRPHRTRPVDIERAVGEVGERPLRAPRLFLLVGNAILDQTKPILRFLRDPARWRSEGDEVLRRLRRSRGRRGTARRVWRARSEKGEREDQVLHGRDYPIARRINPAIWRDRGTASIIQLPMKALRVREFGGPAVLKIEELPDPKAGPGQVVVRVKAVGVNPVDTYIRSGAYAKVIQPPYTPGSDAAGLVDSVGDGVQHVKPGDRVFITGTTSPGFSGACAELTLSRAAQIHPLPPSLTFQQGAGIYVPYGTAYRSLIHRARGQAGETVLVHGASGGVGVASVQLVRATRCAATRRSSECISRTRRKRKRRRSGRHSRPALRTERSVPSSAKNSP